MQSFAIATLTCNDRVTIFDTIQSFFENTDVDHLPIRNSKMGWQIFAQGCTDDHLSKLKKITSELEKKYQVNFMIKLSKENLGLSKGFNVLNKYVSNFDLVLNLEDDWHCLPRSITGLSREWLSNCLSFMVEHSEVSTIFLRKYVDDREKAQYAWNRHVRYVNHKHANNFNYVAKMKNSKIIHHSGVKFQHIPEFLFTFNPCIRRNCDYGVVFPLDEFPDVNNRRDNWSTTQYGDVPKWGWCEAQAMEKTRHLITYNFASGVFGHFEDWQKSGQI